MTAIRTARALIVGGLMLAVATSATAEPRRRAGKSPRPPAAAARAPEDLQLSRDLYQRAEEHYRAGDVERALELYREAYAMTPLPGFLFNIAQCYRRLGQWSTALAYYRAFATAAPKAPNRDQVQQLISLCKRRLTTHRPPTMTAGVTPAVERTVERPVAGRPTAQPVSATIAAPRQASSLFRTDEPRPRSNKRLWIFGGAGLTGALALTGTVTGVMALGASDDYSRPGLTPQRRAELKQRGEALRLASTVTFALAGATAVSTTILYLVDRHQNAKRARFAVAPLQGGGAIVIAKRF